MQLGDAGDQSRERAGELGRVECEGVRVSVRLWSPGSSTIFSSSDSNKATIKCSTRWVTCRPPTALRDPKPLRHRGRNAGRTHSFTQRVVLFARSQTEHCLTLAGQYLDAIITVNHVSISIYGSAQLRYNPIWIQTVLNHKLDVLAGGSDHHNARRCWMKP